MSAPAPGRRLELEPDVGDAVGLGRFLGGAEAGRRGGLERGPEQVGDAGGSLDRRDVPGERHEVPPEALVGEHRRRPLDVARGERLLEFVQPRIGPDGRIATGSRSVDRLTHGGLLHVGA